MQRDMTDFTSFPASFPPSQLSLFWEGRRPSLTTFPQRTYVVRTTGKVGGRAAALPSLRREREEMGRTIWEGRLSFAGVWTRTSPKSMTTSHSPTSRERPPLWRWGAARKRFESVGDITGDVRRVRTNLKEKRP